MVDPIEHFIAGGPARMQTVARTLRPPVCTAMPRAHELLFARHNRIGDGFNPSLGARVVYI